MHSFAAFVPAAQSPQATIMRMGSEVFVISGDRFDRPPLENQQIEFRCGADEARFEDGAAVGAVLFGREPRRGVLEPAIGPRI
jgi:hypothetical protein